MHDNYFHVWLQVSRYKTFLENTPRALSPDKDFCHGIALPSYQYSQSLSKPNIHNAIIIQKSNIQAKKSLVALSHSLRAVLQVLVETSLPSAAEVSASPS